ncbi:PIG-L family deacetylase [Oscillibacter sp. MSJ-2]|uniref:PIG-L family deacetylase n=1 Tax=Dysosmobacter acutus TaxID=2841504 RepID=A0ABS6F4Y3_9FIRM|nr:PIG-L deacetylase family protein [Dysosmobacter acutus]MBU5625354.1 PIG-L family deacetylase [Dysosmobacter acutus]
MNQDRLMVVAAHVGDLVWRCGGTVAKYAAAGLPVKVIILSYGLRGESTSLWKDPTRTWEDAKQRRHAEAEAIVNALGVKEAEYWDLVDYPLSASQELTERLAGSVRAFAPTILLTHDRNRDVMNQDHGLAAELVWQASILAGAAGFRDGQAPVSVTCMFGFEPHMPDMSGFQPDIYIDITDVWNIKQQAMLCNETQKGIIENYVAKAQMRANHFRRMGGRKTCQYAECFSRFYPAFADWLF